MNFVNSTEGTVGNFGALFLYIFETTKHNDDKPISQSQFQTLVPL